MAQNGSRALPHNHPIERALLGAIITRNDALFEVMGIVAKDDFDEPANAEYFTLLLDLIQSGRVVTRISLLEDAAQDADIGGLTASDYINRLVEDAPRATKEVVKDLAMTVRDLAIKRALIRFHEESAAKVYAAPPSIRAEELRLEADAGLAGLYRSVQDLGVQHVGDVGEDVLLRAQAAREDESLGAGISLGLKGVDDLLGPLFPGDVIALGGAPGSGKSALAQQACAWVSRNRGEGFPPMVALYYSIEMPTEQVAGREFAKMTGISPKSIRQGWRLDREQLENLWEVQRGLKKTGFHTVSSSAPTVARVKATAQRMKKLIGLDLLVIDHLQYMAGSSHRMKEVEIVNENAIGVKQMAKDLGVPVILLCQLGTEALRDMEKWPHRKPRKGDLAYSGFVDRNADMILLLHRRETWLRQNKPEADAKHFADYEAALEGARDIAEAILGKNRDGGVGDPRSLYFDGPRYRFSDNLTKAMMKVPNAEELPF